MFEIIESLPKPLVGFIFAVLIIGAGLLRVYFDMKQSGEWNYLKEKERRRKQ